MLFKFPKTLLQAACILALLILLQPASAQTDTVKLRISITDSYTKRGVKDASVINRTTGLSSTTDVNGYVETKASRLDQLFIFAKGYHALPVSIADSNLAQVYFLHLVIEPFAVGINGSVIITGNKSLEGIGADKQHLGITPAELKRPKVPALDVIGQMETRLGARGKEREELKKEMVSDDRWKLMTEYLNYCNEKQLINLPLSKYNDFINYCDMSVAYLKSHADYEILAAISSRFEAFSKDAKYMPQTPQPETEPK